MISVVIGSICTCTLVAIYSSFPAAITSEPKGSTRRVAPGGTTVVAVGSETIAGPSTTAPDGQIAALDHLRR